jgi:hypothetical protein
VASYTYALPSYRFDLSPWLPQLNTRPAGASAGDADKQRQQQQPAGEQEQADMPSTSRRLAGIAVRPPAAESQAAASSDQRLPPKQAATTTAAAGEAPAGTAGAAADAGQQQQQQQREQQPSGHTITVELGGASGSDWILANTLLLWRAGEDENGQPITVTGEQQPSLLLSPGFGGVLSSDCSSTGSGGSLAEAGRCVLQVENRGMLASAVLQMQGSEWLATAQYTTKAYSNDISFNSAVTDGSLAYTQSTKHEARWSVARLTTEGPPAPGGADGAAAAQQQEAGAAAASARPTLLTQSHVRWEWLNAGGVSTGAVYELSYNATLLEPSVFAALGRRSKKEQPTVVGHGRQRHYQRALMVSVYDQAHPTGDGFDMNFPVVGSVKLAENNKAHLSPPPIRSLHRLNDSVNNTRPNVAATTKTPALLRARAATRCVFVRSLWCMLVLLERMRRAGHTHSPALLLLLYNTTEGIPVYTHATAAPRGPALLCPLAAAATSPPR